MEFAYLKNKYKKPNYKNDKMIVFNFVKNVFR